MTVYLVRIYSWGKARIKGYSGVNINITTTRWTFPSARPTTSGCMSDSGADHPSPRITQRRSFAKFQCGLALYIYESRECYFAHLRVWHMSKLNQYRED